jgi:hypothetical protein
MSMAAEYEEEVAFVEPEHPDRQILDRFFDKLTNRDLSGAAKELRTLHARGGSLCRSDIEIVADLFDGSAAGFVFPYKLGFTKRGRGRPSLQSQLQGLWNAFAIGDEVKASEALRKLDALGGPDLKTLSGLLGDDPELHACFPWRLVLQKQKPGSGRPRTMRTQARQWARAFMAAEARSRDRAKRAIGELCERTKLSRATVYNAEKAMRDKSRIN